MGVEARDSALQGTSVMASRRAYWLGRLAPQSRRTAAGGAVKCCQCVVHLESLLRACHHSLELLQLGIGADDGGRRGHAAGVRLRRLGGGCCLFHGDQDEGTQELSQGVPSRVPRHGRHQVAVIPWAGPRARLVVLDGGECWPAGVEHFGRHHLGLADNLGGRRRRAAGGSLCADAHGDASAGGSARGPRNSPKGSGRRRRAGAGRQGAHGASLDAHGRNHRGALAGGAGASENGDTRIVCPKFVTGPWYRPLEPLNPGYLPIIRRANLLWVS